MAAMRGRGTSASSQSKRDKSEKTELEDFIKDRDYVGAYTLLDFNRRTGDKTKTTVEWMAWCSFHSGEYKKALELYDELLQGDPENGQYMINKAVCLFYLGMYKEAESIATMAPSSALQNRLLFHISHKFGDESTLLSYHQKLQDTTEDQLCLAAIHYHRSHYQEAIDVYKRVLEQNRDYIALNVYVALCYYKLDYHDVSAEVLNVYLQQNPTSPLALNLKACNHFKLYDGKAAEKELKPLQEANLSPGNLGYELMQHNLVVFRNGENALQVLPPLLDIIPEARLNLVIYYFHNDEIQEAFNLIKDLEPNTPQEYTLKGVVHAAYGQMTESKEHLKVAQHFFQLVGASPAECDTIPGRQCMASCFFLLKQFEDVLIYLNSIKNYFQNDDDFNWNYGIAKASNGEYKDAEEALVLIQNEKYKNDYVYVSWLARCYIMNEKARLAWELYLKMETSTESFNLLQLIANDCYKTGAFYFSAKAFDVLERLDPNPEYWEGKRGSCVGVFRQVIAGQEPPETLKDIINMLRNTSNPQIDYIIRAIKNWAKEKGFKREIHQQNNQNVTE